jgi:ribosomal protein L29
MSKEVRDNIMSLKKKLLSLRFKKSSGEVSDTSAFKETRKNIARLFTKINKKEGK